jgi:hypothetical protein
MTNMISVALITGNSIRTNELGQCLMTDITKAVMPEGGGGRGGSEGSSAGWCWWKEWVEVTHAIAPGDHAPCLEVLHKKAKWVKLDGKIIVSGETTNGNQILNNVR